MIYLRDVVRTLRKASKQLGKLDQQIGAQPPEARSKLLLQNYLDARAGVTAIINRLTALG